MRQAECQIVTSKNREEFVKSIATCVQSLDNFRLEQVVNTVFPLYATQRSECRQQIYELIYKLNTKGFEATISHFRWNGRKMTYPIVFASETSIVIKAPCNKTTALFVGDCVHGHVYLDGCVVPCKFTQSGRMNRPMEMMANAELARKMRDSANEPLFQDAYGTYYIFEWNDESCGVFALRVLSRTDTYEWDPIFDDDRFMDEREYDLPQLTFIPLAKSDAPESS